MTGEVGILNVGAGDTKLSFDPSNPGEVKRASRIVTDMLHRGFALMIEVGNDEKGPLWRRATGFDAETAEYIIMDVPDEMEDSSVEEPASTPKRGRPRKAAQPKRVKASGTNAVSVARTAGG